MISKLKNSILTIRGILAVDFFFSSNTLRVLFSNKYVVQFSLCTFSTIRKGKHNHLCLNTRTGLSSPLRLNPVNPNSAPVRRSQLCYPRSKHPYFKDCETLSTLKRS